MILQYTGPEDWGETAYPGDAGIDIPIVDQQILEPGEFYDLPSGLRVAIPEGYYGRIAARSGALRNRRIRVYEGVIDSGFRGELFTFVEAVGPTATAVRPGDRLAQLILQPTIRFPIERVADLPPSERGTKGFGSSDRKHVHDTDFHETGWCSGCGLRRDPDVLFADLRHAINEIKTLPEIYLGGPIDGQDHTARSERLEMLVSRIEAVWYDPLLEGVGIADPAEVERRNVAAMNRCDLAVFLFPDPPNYGFGSPIEVEYLTSLGKRPIIWHNSDQVGVYLRNRWSQGAIITTEWRDFVRVLGEEMTKARNGQAR